MTTKCIEKLAPLKDCCEPIKICIPDDPRDRDIDPYVMKLQNEAFKVFLTAFQMFKPNEFMFTFNGGKDCTIVLYLLLKFFRKNAVLRHIQLPVVYIKPKHSFTEMEEFVDRSKELFDVDVIKREGDVREVLNEFIAENPHIKAVFMGCRSTDPHCNTLQVMQLTDLGWPNLMRVNPIMNWSYGDVWKYIKAFNIPYCCLYDQGYTSLGNKENTIANPALKVLDPITCKFIRYDPAYMLADDSLERWGRV